MAYKKKSSVIIEKARRRVSGIESISPTLDLGNGLTCVAYNTKINQSAAALDTYNTLLSQADAALSTFEAIEEELSALSERMLAGVAVRYGFDSIEYEKAGGTRKSETKRAVRKAKAA